MIRAVIWDMSGVLIEETVPPSRTTWEDRLGLSDGELTRMVFWHPLAVDLAQGRADPSELWRHLELDLGLSEGHLENLSHDFWGDPLWRPDVLAYVDLLKGCRKQAVLSDAWINTRATVTAQINLERFDLIMFSAEEGLKKPDSRIFRRAVDRLSVSPQEVIFVDDRLANVEGALRVGMKAIEFTGFADVRRRIDDLIAREEG